MWKELNLLTDENEINRDTLKVVFKMNKPKNVHWVHKTEHETYKNFQEKRRNYNNQ